MIDDIEREIYILETHRTIKKTLELMGHMATEQRPVYS